MQYLSADIWQYCSPLVSSVKCYTKQMKLLLKIFLETLLFVLIIIVVISSTIKFQLLKPDYWHSHFQPTNVYEPVAQYLREMFEEQTVKEGGSRADAKILTDIISGPNLELFIEKNITNILNFMNGEASQLFVFIPINLLPPGLLPRGLNIEELTPVDRLLTIFNVKQDLQLQRLSTLGPITHYLLIISIALSLLLMMILYKITDSGKRLWSNAFPFILSGLLVLILVGVGYVIKVNMGSELVKSSIIGDRVLGTILPVIIGGIVATWLVVGVLLLTLGVGLVFIRKK